MLRLVLSMVLTFVVALPPGMCFCHCLEPASGTIDASQNDHDLPQDGPNSPDDDGDCPCKLREPLACGPEPVVPQNAAAAPIAILEQAVGVGTCVLSTNDGPVTARTSILPAPQIPCALRI